jgi:hypothetical protein
MDDATSETRTCEVCGAPLNRTNVSGLCAGPSSPAKCRQERARRIRLANGVPPRVKAACGHPDGCGRAVHGEGYCSTHLARLRRNGALGPVGLINNPRTIKPGESFNMWTALEGYGGEFGTSEDYRVPCRCECGRERRVLVATLKNGSSKGCGCAKPHIKVRLGPRKPYLLPGEIYGLLTVLDRVDRSTDRARFRCECGRVVEKQAQPVKKGHTRSCGCLVRTLGGLSRHPLWPTWSAMIARTSQPDHKDYERYGGRGITVCKRWQGKPEGFRNFIADVGERPAGRSLDRTDNDGGYWCGGCDECVSFGRPANWAWETYERQTRNKRSVAKLTRQLGSALAKVAELEGEVSMLRTMLAAERGTLF